MIMSDNPDNLFNDSIPEGYSVAEKCIGGEEIEGCINLRKLILENYPMARFADLEYHWIQGYRFTVWLPDVD